MPKGSSISTAEIIHALIVMAHALVCAARCYVCCWRQGAVKMRSTYIGEYENYQNECKFQISMGLPLKGSDWNIRKDTCIRIRIEWKKTLFNIGRLW